VRIAILAVGRLKAGPERDLVARYEGRALALARGLGVSGPDIIEILESRARREEDRRREEGASLRSRIGGAASIVLDERAPSLPSEGFADLIRGRMEAGGDLAFVIGGPDGLDAVLRSQGRALSFGALTLPHQLVRVLLLEQVYRALTILAGHPYHRAGGDD
jgi:23S rRNA (pseudouridine1915-N3)-methyltransferase